MLGIRDITVRVARLEQMTLSFGKEVLVLREANDPLLYLERQAYLKAIQDALSGIESARVTLAKVRQRMETCSLPEKEKGTVE